MLRSCVAVATTHGHAASVVYEVCVVTVLGMVPTVSTLTDTWTLECKFFFYVIT